RAGPGAHRFPLPVEYPDDRIGEVADLPRIDVHRRPRHRTGLGDLDMGEVGRLAGAHLRLRHVKAEGSRALLLHVASRFRSPFSSSLTISITRCKMAHALGPVRGVKDI